MAVEVRDELVRSAQIIGASHGYESLRCKACNGTATVQLEGELLKAVGSKPGDRCPVCLGFVLLFLDPATEEMKNAYDLLEDLGVTILPRSRISEDDG